MKVEEEIIRHFKNEANKNLTTPTYVGLTTNDIAEKFSMLRSNASNILNKLYKENILTKSDGRPVYYKITTQLQTIKSQSSFEQLIGNDGLLKKCIQQAKVAISYPPNGLHTLLLGPTGVGKTLFAELMYRFAIENHFIQNEAAFVSFNCADYANNSQLLLGQLFGYKKGAFTGANDGYSGVVEKANNGILFLDEIHRLPPEGQELLFYLIDKGEYSRLGEATEKHKVNVLIICATTEDVDSALLQTFTRRIPMTISIPALRDRGPQEKFQLISMFFQQEAKRVNRTIHVKRESIKNLLAYNCPGNVGQLKSDIQLICANAFFDCISNGGNDIEIELAHLPSHVKKGIIQYRDFKEHFEGLLGDNEIFSFTFDQIHSRNDIKEEKLNFYEKIEARLNELENKNFSSNDIQLIMNLEIENYFKRFIGEFEDIETNLTKFVDKNLISLVEELLLEVSNKLGTTFPARVYYGLCFHLHSSILRLKEGGNIANQNLLDIKHSYPIEYGYAIDFCHKLEEHYHIKMPENEISFITMFLCSEKIEEKHQSVPPTIIIAMHGKSTATSMAEVVNRLLGINSILAYDMPLDKSAQIGFDELKQIIRDNHIPSGVLLLVDMGSLGMFGELIAEELGINIKTIDMITTVVALDIARKAEIEHDIEIIYQSITNQLPLSLGYGTKKYDYLAANKETAILTVCTTGEGSAMRIKSLIEDNIDISKHNMHVIPLSISNRVEMEKHISSISKRKKILLIVGTIDPKIYGIPFMPLSDLIMFNQYDKIEQILETHQPYFLNKMNEEVREEQISLEKILDSLSQKLKYIKTNEFQPLFEVFLQRTKDEFGVHYDNDKLAGMTFHIANVIENIINNKVLAEFKQKDSFMITHANGIRALKESLSPIELAYKLYFSDDSICFIYQMLRNL
ncbi:sigma 54-interacting transcriptional regulator [Priestia megaterium]|uniref:Sigma 54-interacting transcriptional regulator n=1 Tax=Priestia megaterium TaxID=1404 RepID=A0A6H1NYZ8_PRIMG|nr:sigma-54-dependent transcriptional regulator [Priestia megaterium]QIZ06452.1 sigma 54-interacting transcriptional regulator [Priestia megaterium]